MSKNAKGYEARKEIEDKDLLVEEGKEMEKVKQVAEQYRVDDQAE